MRVLPPGALCAIALSVTLGACAPAMPVAGGIRTEPDRTAAQGQDGERESQQPGATIQFDTKGVEFGPWLKRFVAQVRRNWFIPQAAMDTSGHVGLQFNIHRDGAITDIAVVQPSSIDAFTNAAYGAIVTSNPTVPLPPEYPSEQALFTVTFYYNEEPLF